MGCAKRALIVGGASGIGLAVANELLGKGFVPVIIDRSEPVQQFNDVEIEFCKTDLSFFDEKLFQDFASDPSITSLVITAGFGRVAGVGDLSIKEIDNLLEVNAAAAIKILRIFWNRITSSGTFRCAVMASIAGMVSSPFFSVYAASKAALWRFCESANAELATTGNTNRITCVSPGHVSGTGFDGGEGRSTGLESFAKEFVQRMSSCEELWVPDADGVYSGVIRRYVENPIAFGLESARYKIESGRLGGGRKPVIGYCSGTFDLFHAGHLHLLKSARCLCEELVVGVHPDASHKGKKTFISHEERKAIVESCRYVDRVIDAPREDSTAWELIHYDRLFVGSDYKGTERFARYERELGSKGVQVIYFPYTEGISSTQLRSAIVSGMEESAR